MFVRLCKSANFASYIVLFVVMETGRTNIDSKFSFLRYEQVWFMTKKNEEEKKKFVENHFLILYQYTFLTALFTLECLCSTIIYFSYHYSKIRNSTSELDLLVSNYIREHLNNFHFNM